MDTTTEGRAVDAAAAVKDPYLGHGFIETYSGHHFSLQEPVFDLTDIIHALSNTCRYGGHCSRFYSVAEHSCLVGSLMRELDLGDPREGLLHDATEAYLSDVPAPFKQYLPEWKALDDDLDAKLREHFGIGPHSAGMKTADRIALFIEASMLMPDGGECYHDPWGLKPVAYDMMENPMWVIKCLDPEEAKKQYAAYLAHYGIKD